MTAESQGTLWLVVGPSGSGKDTLIRGAAKLLSDDDRYCFPTRQITRPQSPGDEQHQSISWTEFEARRTAGCFGLCWCAHGNGYGVPVTIELELRQGRNVVVNVSRGVLQEAEARYSKVRVVSVHASQQSLRARILDRGREDLQEVEARLARAGQFVVEGPNVSDVVNDQSIAAGVRQLVLQLRRES